MQTELEFLTQFIEDVTMIVSSSYIDSKNIVNLIKNRQQIIMEQEKQSSIKINTVDSILNILLMKSLEMENDVLRNRKSFKNAFDELANSIRIIYNNAPTGEKQ
jgi:hypothetical protein